MLIRSFRSRTLCSFTPPPVPPPDLRSLIASLSLPNPAQNINYIIHNCPKSYNYASITTSYTVPAPPPTLSSDPSIISHARSQNLFSLGIFLDKFQRHLHTSRITSRDHASKTSSAESLVPVSCERRFSFEF